MRSSAVYRGDVMCYCDSGWILQPWCHTEGTIRCINSGWKKYDVTLTGNVNISLHLIRKIQLFRSRCNLIQIGSSQAWAGDRPLIGCCWTAVASDWLGCWCCCRGLSSLKQCSSNHHTNALWDNVRFSVKFYLYSLDWSKKNKNKITFNYLVTTLLKEFKPVFCRLGMHLNRFPRFHTYWVEIN